MRRAAVLGVLLVCAYATTPLVAQDGGEAEDTFPTFHPLGDVYPLAAQVPFGLGEHLEYQVKLGIFEVGTGFLTVHGVDSVRGNPSYHVSMKIEGGLLFAKVDDHFQSWIDVKRLMSRRFIQDQHEANYERFRHFEFFPEEWRWERADTEDDTGELPTSIPLDDISFIYFVRSLPLEVGQEYTFRRYFRDSGNPVLLRVVRRDEVEVPAGVFKTIVVEPTIQTRGLFGKGGEAELHFTDDDRRLLVYMRSKVPVLGSLTLHLREIREGVAIPRTAEELSLIMDQAAAGRSTAGGTR